MKLSYADIIGDGSRHQIDATITTAHNQSSYGQPVILLDGSAQDLLDATSWVLLNYSVVEATDDERRLLHKWLSNLNFLITGQVTPAPMLTTAEVAARLGVSERRVRALIAARRVGSKIGGTWLVREDELPSLIPGPGHWPKGRPRKPKA